jgi:hypothetical protein
MRYRSLRVPGLIILALTSALAFGQRSTGSPKMPPARATARIHGCVTDFEGRPIEGAEVELKTSDFQKAAAATTGSDGTFSLTAPEGLYMALTAVKDYQTKCLEYWAWSVPAFGELRIDPRFDRLEVYALNAWRPQGAYPSYQIYFRPMSLAKTASLVMKAGGMAALTRLPLVDIAPHLEAEDIQVRIDGERVDVLRVDKVREVSGPTQDMFAYLIQVGLPKRSRLEDWVVFDVTLSDRTTGERGEGWLYLPRPHLR